MKNSGDPIHRLIREAAEMDECLHFYKTRLSPSLSNEQKEKLMWHIYDYRLAHIPLLDDNPISEFPELEKYWGKDTLSGLELVILQDQLYKDTHKPEEE